MSTPHNAAKKGDIAKVVLMPGDPLRAKFVAETWLDDPVCFNEVRGALGYTGTYKGKPVSVMASGMGVPSIGIYSYELYHEYDVDVIIRIGSAGGIQDDVKLRDVIIGVGACTDSNFASQYRLPGTFAPIADFGLVETAVAASRDKGIPVHVGNLFTSDKFYNADPDVNDRWKSMGVLGVEMEAAGLYMNAAYAGKKALAICTVSDHLYRPEILSAEERQSGLVNMIEIALETAYRCQ